METVCNNIPTKICNKLIYSGYNIACAKMFKLPIVNCIVIEM